MKSIFLMTLFSIFALSVHAQFVAKVQMDEEVEGVCDMENVYSIFPGMKGQREPEQPISNEEIEQKVNENCQFLKDNPKHKDEGMISLIVNCEGEVVQCEMDGCCLTKSTDLDAQLIEIFQSLGKWKPGRVGNSYVDCMVLISFTIKKGKIKLN